MPLRCSPLEIFIAGASLLSLELPRLPRSFAVFPGVPQSSPEFSSLCWSSSLSTGVPPCPPEFLLVHRSSSLSTGVPPCPPEFLLVRWSSCYFLGAPCHELAFFTLFSPSFSQGLRSLSFRTYLIKPTTLVSNHFVCSLSSQIIRKTRVLNPKRSRHNVCTTMGDPFQNKTKHELYSMRVRPLVRSSKTTPPPGSENPPCRSSRS